MLNNLKMFIVIFLCFLLVLSLVKSLGGFWLNDSEVIPPIEDKKDTEDTEDTYPAETEGLIYEIGEDGTYAVCIGLGDATTDDIVIASTYEGLPVTVIGESAFVESGITSVVIPSTVTTIDECAFMSCSALTSVIIPDSVVFIGDSAFDCCENLKTVSFGEDSQLRTIGEYAFVDCSIESIFIPARVAYIGIDAFYASLFSLKKLYYGGDQSDWDNIEMLDEQGVAYATCYYYSEIAPTESGNYWHYVDGEIVVWGE